MYSVQITSCPVGVFCTSHLFSTQAMSVYSVQVTCSVHKPCQCIMYKSPVQYTSHVSVLCTSHLFSTQAMSVYSVQITSSVLKSCQCILYRSPVQLVHKSCHCILYKSPVMYSSPVSVFCTNHWSCWCICTNHQFRTQVLSVYSVQITNSVLKSCQYILYMSPLQLVHKSCHCIMYMSPVLYSSPVSVFCTNH